MVHRALDNSKPNRSLFNALNNAMAGDQNELHGSGLIVLAPLLLVLILLLGGCVALLCNALKRDRHRSQFLDSNFDFEQTDDSNFAQPTFHDNVNIPRIIITRDSITVLQGFDQFKKRAAKE
uniref:Uncharacterized protein n=1 Tax=Plectus sambesii TaxID=2011161 RepID=A0A914W6M4_9BILA